jgi:hypothetical protein
MSDLQFKSGSIGAAMRQGLNDVQRCSCMCMQHHPMVAVTHHRNFRQASDRNRSETTVKNAV